MARYLYLVVNLKHRLAWLLIACSLFISPASLANPWLDQSITPADARHLLARTGFDAAPEAQSALSGLTRAEAIDLILKGFDTQPQTAMPAWTSDTAPLYWTRRDMDEQSRREFDRLRDQELAGLRTWWIDEMLTTTSPQTERMVLFWHDHFATSYNGINRQSIAMARQNQTFRELGMGSFETLLRAMVRDPALLTYLNNITNRKSSPNENLARELMELFTLGEGNYDEGTVKEAARALTGYGVSQNRNLTARFNEWQHDWDEKTLFGETGKFDGDDLVSLLLKQSALDEHIATRFWHLLVADRAPTPGELKPLADAFRQSGHRLDVLYRTVLSSREFWDDEQRGAIIKSPVTLFIGTARLLDTPKRISEQLPRLLKLAGQDLFSPPNVSGWEEGPAWITSGRLLNRYTGLKTLLASTVKDTVDRSENTADNAMDAPTEMAMSSDGNMMSNAMSADEQAPNEDGNAMAAPATKGVLLKLAGENMDGPPQYRVELLNADESAIWASEPYSLKGGWDTARFGPVSERYELPWQTIQLPLSGDQLENAHALRVHFINDAANESGDRNLYVGALSFTNGSVFPQAGSQVSECVPPNPADVGDLYCQGYVDFSLASLNPVAEKDTNQSQLVRYASKHVGWANHNANNGVVNARIVFQDLRFNERHWPVFSAWYRLQPNGEFVMWLNSQECWENCVEQWPDCAWPNEREPGNLMLNFAAFGVRNDADRQCHADSLQAYEARLVDALMIHAQDLLTETLAEENARNPKNRSNIKDSLMMLVKRLQQADVVQAMQQATPTGRTKLQNVPPVIQDESARRAYPKNPVSGPLIVKAASLDERQHQIQQQGFSWSQALAPGIDVSKLPGWSENENQALQGAKLHKVIQKMLLNPAYQVY